MKTTYKNIWDEAKAVLRGTFIAINTYIKISNNLTSHLKKLRKEKTRPKVIRSKEIKIKAEINKIENRKTIEKSMNVVFLKRSTKLPTFSWTKITREKT